MAAHTFKEQRSLRNIARIIEALAAEMDAEDLAAHLHLGYSTTCKYLSHMVSQKQRQIRISRWVPKEGGGHPTPMYKQGVGRNAARPARKTGSAAWAEVKADPAKIARRMACNRKSYRRRNGLPPSPLPVASPFAALGL